jgi:predicted MFS family arabinose efflux permease
VVAATTAAQVASVMGTAVFPVIAPALAPALGVEASLVGYQVSLIYGTATAASPFVSSLIPRWGACRVTQAGLGCCALGMLLAMASDLAALVAASVLLGIGISVMPSASSHLLYRFTPQPHQHLVFGLKQTGIPLAWVLMAAIAPAITLAAGWRWALALVLAVALATAAAMQPWRARWDDDRGTAGAAGPGLLAGLGVVWRHEVLRWTAAMSFCFTFVQHCIASFTVTMLVEEAGYSLVAAGFLLSLANATGVAGRIVWGLVADALGEGLRVLRWIGAAMTGACVALAFVSSAWPGWLLAALFAAAGASAIAWNGLFLSESARRSPHGQVSLAIGGAMVWCYGGVLAGPALFATAYRYLGAYTDTFGLLAIAAAAGLYAAHRAGRAARAG